MAKSTLIYGLETIHITKAQMNRLNAFQVKGLRTMMKMQHSFMNRSNTNEVIIQKANDWISSVHKNKHIESIEKTLAKRRIKLLGHILRADNDDLTRKISFEPNTATP